MPLRAPSHPGSPNSPSCSALAWYSCWPGLSPWGETWKRTWVARTAALTRYRYATQPTEFCPSSVDWNFPTLYHDILGYHDHVLLQYYQNLAPGHNWLRNNLSLYKPKMLLIIHSVFILVHFIIMIVIDPIMWSDNFTWAFEAYIRII